MRSLSLSSLVAGAVGVAASAVVVLAPTASAATPAAGTYVPVTAFRALERPVRHGHTVTVQIGGRGHVPARVSAVAITMTVTSATGSGGLIAYPAGTRRPAPRDLLYSAGRNTSVSAIVRMPPSGRLAVYDTAESGSTMLAVDVAGYYVAGTPSPMPGVMHTVVPRHVLAGRSLGAHRTLATTVGGRAGVPTSGVGAVAVLVHVIAPTRFGSVVAYRAGGPRPHAPAVTFARGIETVGFALVPVDAGGRIALYNASSGRARVAIDIVGYTAGGVVTAAGATQVGTAVRVLSGAGLKARSARTVQVTGHTGLPSTRLAAVLVSVTVTARSRNGSAVVWPGTASRPPTTNLQFRAHDTASGTAIVPVSSRGTIAIRNVSRAAIALSVDIDGYVPAAAAAVVAPKTSNSRYIREIGGVGDTFSDPGTTGDGCVDATASSTLVLLEFGAQLNDGSGVELTGTNQLVPYSTLISSIDNYLAGFAACSPPAHATIALGTNNEGDFAKFTAGDRGAAWADNVIDKVTVPGGVRVVGANDIEPSFASTEQQAQQWEAGYLAATSADLVFNGSADGCPTTLGRTGATCAYGWTMQQLYDLAHNGSRVQVLPQVYLAAQAAQWANIDATGHGGLIFAGVLTEYQACPAPSAACPTASYQPQQGWMALYRAVSTVVRGPRIPAATDLRGDG